jgi:hypothetical protein
MFGYLISNGYQTYYIRIRYPNKIFIFISVIEKIQISKNFIRMSAHHLQVRIQTDIFRTIWLVHGLVVRDLSRGAPRQPIPFVSDGTRKKKTRPDWGLRLLSRSDRQFAFHRLQPFFPSRSSWRHHMRQPAKVRGIPPIYQSIHQSVPFVPPSRVESGGRTHRCGRG